MMAPDNAGASPTRCGPPTSSCCPSCRRRGRSASTTTRCTACTRISWTSWRCAHHPVLTVLKHLFCGGLPAQHKPFSGKPDRAFHFGLHTAQGGLQSAGMPSRKQLRKPVAPRHLGRAGKGACGRGRHQPVGLPEAHRGRAHRRAAVAQAAERGDGRHGPGRSGHHEHDQRHHAVRPRRPPSARRVFQRNQSESRS